MSWPGQLELILMRSLFYFDCETMHHTFNRPADAQQNVFSPWLIICARCNRVANVAASSSE
eukprot:scaffold299865_cov32-Prasinocladus_malaysianus.AAC.1